MQFTTITQFVDVETGEVLTERHIKKELYLKIKLTTKYKKDGDYRTTRINTWHCEKNKQQEIQF